MPQNTSRLPNKCNYLIWAFLPLLLTLLTYLSPSAFADGDADGDGVADGQETIDGTDKDDPDSYIEHGSSEYCMEWNGFLSDLFQVFELRNAGCGTLEVQVVLRSIDGAAKGGVAVTIPEASQFDVIANALDGFEAGSYGLLCATITSGDPDSIDAQMTLYDQDGDTFNFAYAVPFTIARTGSQYLGYNHFFPTLSSSEQDNFVAGYVQISNEETTTQTGTLLFYDQAGTQIASIGVAVSGKGRADIGTHDATGTSKIGTIEWRPTASDKKFRVVLSRYYFDSDGFLKTALSVPAKRGSGYLLASPFSTVSRFAVLELNNTLSSAIEVPVVVRDESGAATSTQPGSIPIAAKGTYHLVLNPYLPSGLGKVQIDSDTPQSVAATLLEYGLIEGQRLKFASVGELSAGFGSGERGSYNNFLGSCRLRLANISASERTATITMTRYDGTSLGIDSPLTVPGNGALEVNICSNESQPAYGEVKLVPSVTESIVGEMVRSNSDSSAEFRVALSQRSICTAHIEVSPETLSLTVNASAGTLTVTNNSASVTATNIVAALPSDFSDVTQDASDCTSVGAGENCEIIFTPGSTTHSQADVAIQGDNTSRTSALIDVQSGSTLTVVNPTSGTASGGTGVTLTGTGLTGATAVTFDGVPATSVNVVNSTTVTAVTSAHAVGAVDVVIDTPAGGATLANGYTYQTTAVGQSTGGGTIACLNGGLNNLIAATADNSTAIEWGGFGTAIGAAAQSTTDGASNTTAIVAALGNNGGTPYAAQLCNDFEVDSQGNTPCQAGNTCYDDWFLPAGNNITASGQQNCLFSNRAAIGGFTNALYWTSTEFSGIPANNAWAQSFGFGPEIDDLKSVGYRVRCVRAFTP